MGSGNEKGMKGFSIICGLGIGQKSGFGCDTKFSRVTHFSGGNRKIVMRKVGQRKIRLGTDESEIQEVNPPERRR